MLTLTERTLKALCAALSANVVGGSFAGPLKGCYVGLATAGPAPTKDVLRSDYTEATYTGYARQALGTPGAAFNGSDELTKIVYPGLQFQPSDGVTPNTITHVLIFDANTAGNLVAVEQLDTPIPLPNADSAMIYDTNVGFPTGASYGGGVSEH